MPIIWSLTLLSYIFLHKLIAIFDNNLFRNKYNINLPWAISATMRLMSEFIHVFLCGIVKVLCDLMQVRLLFLLKLNFNAPTNC